MTKNVTFLFESQVALGKSADESSEMCGKIEAMLTTWGAREGADGRRFNYQAAPFKAWASEFAATGKPLPMYLTVPFYTDSISCLPNWANAK